MECSRKFEKCKGIADGLINGKPVCRNCVEHGEQFDRKFKDAK